MKLKIKQSDIDAICLKLFNGIEANKFQLCLTKGGNIAVIFSTNSGGVSPLLGAYYTSDKVDIGEWMPAKWLSDGRYPGINHTMKSTSLDLIINEEYDKIVA